MIASLYGPLPIQSNTILNNPPPLAAPLPVRDILLRAIIAHMSTCTMSWGIKHTT